jgi:hypothetical protein
VAFLFIHNLFYLLYDSHGINMKVLLLIVGKIIVMIVPVSIKRLYEMKEKEFRVY